MTNQLSPDERMCPGTGHVTTCVDDCLAEGPSCRRAAAEQNQRFATLERMVDGIVGGKPDPRFIEHIRNLFNAGHSLRQIREFVERTVPPRLFAFPGSKAELQPIEFDPDGRLQERLREVRFEPDVMVVNPQMLIRAPAAEDVQRGDLVTIDSAGRAARAEDGRVVGVALGDGLFQTEGIEMSWAGRPRNFDYGSHMYASIAYRPQVHRTRMPWRDRPASFQYNEKFPKEVEDKALKLLEKFMSADQYDAFLKGSRIELENKAGDHRLLIDRAGDFSILKGPRGAGIMMTSGRCRSYKYPLGDEIAAFLDWFNHRTLELIDRWRCGTFGIVDDGKLR